MQHDREILQACPERPRPGRARPAVLGGGRRGDGRCRLRRGCPELGAVHAPHLGATVRVIDRNSSADFSCTLATVRSNGTVQQFQTVRSTGSSPAPQSLTFSGQSAASGGSYSLECTMPAFIPGTNVSTLVNYTVVE